MRSALELPMRIAPRSRRKNLDGIPDAPPEIATAWYERLLEESENGKRAAPPRRTLTMAEAAKRLGVCYSMLWYMVSGLYESPRFKRVGARIFFLPEWLDEFQGAVQATHSADSDIEVMTFKEAAAYIGVDRSLFHLLMHGYRGKPPRCVRVGRDRIFAKQWLEEWFEVNG